MTNPPTPIPADLEERILTTLRAELYAPGTIRRYLTWIHSLATFIAPKTLAETTSDDVRRYLAQASTGKGYATTTVNQCLSAFRFLFGRILLTPLTEPFRPHPDETLPTVLAQTRIRSLLAATTNTKHKLALALAYSAGLRVGEIATLKTTDIDQDRMTIRIRMTKGRKYRSTILARTTAWILEDYLSEYHPATWLFEGQSSGHITVRTLQAVFTQARSKAGIRIPATMHTLRHSFATHLVESGTELERIRTLLGHASIDTTRIYTRTARTPTLTSPLDAP